MKFLIYQEGYFLICLLYTSDAADDQHIKDSEMKVKQQLNYAIQAFNEKLNELPLVELLEDEYFKHKLVDWNDNDRTEQ